MPRSPPKVGALRQPWAFGLSPIPGSYGPAIGNLSFPKKGELTFQDAGEAIKDPEYSKKMTRADGLAIVAPEYNHGYPGGLKQLLDTCLEEYIHKAVGLCGVSAGPFGGARVIENLLPVMREIGLAVTFTDVNFSRVEEAFDEAGNLIDEKYVGRVAKFLNELVWMARVLRYGRENIPPL